MAVAGQRDDMRLAPLPLLGVLALAGCSWFGPGDTTPQAQCQRQAYDDPEVKRLMTLRLSSNLLNQQLDRPYNSAVQQATVACLRRRGLAAPGGVEPVTRSTF
jgi:hypothetical protein